MKGWGRRLGLVGLLALTAQGCYEGWDDYKQSGVPTPAPPPPPPPPAAKPIGYLLFEPISMGADAMSNTTCFPQTGFAQFKSAEWSERIASIQTALMTIADTVVTQAVTVGADDCTTLAAIQAQAITQTPWGTNASPESDTSGKPEVELTAAFWEPEPALTPPGPVVAPSWAGWQTLINEGRDAGSLHYFVISNPSNGYFTSWASQLSASTTLSGTPINQVDPTQNGITARDALVAKDTAALITWITGQVK